MAKKPFAIRIEEEAALRFKALAVVKNRDDNAALFDTMVAELEKGLNMEERDAYDALLKLWKDNQ